MRPKYRLWTSEASHRNALALFSGQWASDLAEVDPTAAHSGFPMFKHDPRPRQAAAVFGQAGRLDGMHVLELGPLEGAHSYQLEQLGAASVTAIEANADAFLRCLVIKNMLALDRTTFLLGDCLPYLKGTPREYDLIFASGILYHMENPVELVRRLALCTRHVFLWTTYYDPSFTFASGKKLPHRKLRYEHDGWCFDTFVLNYRGRHRVDFWGGNRATACWLELDTIVEAFHRYGFTEANVIDEDRSGVRGPAATIAFSKPRC